MKKKQWQQENKNRKQNIFSLSLFVNLESCCIAWEANTTETKCEGAAERLEKWGEEEEEEDSDMKDKARDVQKKKKSAVGQKCGAGGQLEDVAVIRAGRLVVPSQDDWRQSVQRSLSPYRAVEKDM